jgi:aryl-alcohol dehydrogenase
MKTRAAILSKINAKLTIDTVEVGKPKFGEVLVRMIATGICHTDISVINGTFQAPLPIILGHEGAAIVEALGPGVTTLRVGDHVVITPLTHCGNCRFCLQGEPFYCNGLPDTSFEGTMPDGTSRFTYKGKKISHLFCQSSFAEHSVVWAKSCVKVPKDAPLEKLGPLACGVSTGAGAVLNIAKVRAGDTVAIFGCGGVGLAAVMAAKLAGALQIIAVDVLDQRLEIARKLGATDTIQAKKGDPVKKIQKLTDGGVDYAFECIGRQDTILSSIDCIRMGGTAVITGGVPDGTEVTLNGADLLTKNIRGNLAGASIPELFIPMLIKYWQRGDFPFDRLTSKTYTLNEINQAIFDMIKGKVIKPIILF